MDEACIVPREALHLAHKGSAEAHCLLGAHCLQDLCPEVFPVLHFMKLETKENALQESAPVVDLPKFAVEESKGIFETCEFGVDSSITPSCRFSPIPPPGNLRRSPLFQSRDAFFNPSSEPLEAET